MGDQWQVVVRWGGEALRAWVVGERARGEELWRG
jgi:hypothetical protein